MIGLDHNLGEAQLLRTPPLQPNESLWGYMTRVAEANGYERPSWLAELVGVNDILKVGEEGIAALALLVGGDPEALGNLVYSPVYRGMRNFAGGKVPGRLLSRSSPRICPFCIRSNGVRRIEWDLSLVSCCPLHGCQLIDRCQECYTSLSWKKARVAHCGKAACEADLRDARPREASDAAVQLTALVLRATGLQSGYTNVYDGRYKALEHLDIQALSQLILFLGGHAIGRARGAGARLSSRLGAGEMLHLVTAASEMFSDWPNKYFDLLEVIRVRNCARDNKTGLANEFGSFYEALGKKFRGEEFAFLLDATTHYLEKNWTGGFLSTKNTLLQPSSENNAAWLTGAQCARRLHKRSETIERLIDQGALKGTKRVMGKRQLMLVSAKSLGDYEERQADELTLDEAKEVLGVSGRAMGHLIDKGIVRSLRRKPINRSRSQVFSRVGLEKLLAKLVAQAQPRSKEGVPFDKAIRSLTAIGFTVGDLVEKILKGQLLVNSVDRSKVGLKRLCLNEERLSQLIAKHTRAPTDTMTIPILANKLGVKQEVAYSLANKEFIKARKVTVGPRTIRVVSDQDLKRFQRRYVSAKALASEHRTSPKKVIEKLMAEGIAPAIGGPDDGCRQAFYRRTDVQVLKPKAA